MKKSLNIILSVLILCALLTGCVDETEVSESEEATSTVNVETAGTVEVPETAVTGDDVTGDAVITLNGTSITVSGTGATAEGCVVTITEPGDYVISGTLDDGQIIVNAKDEDKVRLIFNGVSIYCSTSAPIYILSAEKVIIELAEGSVNMVSDGASYVLAEGSDEPDAAIFSKDDLKIKGTGTLYVTGNYMRGIHTKDTLQIEEATVYVTAVDDGLRGNDAVEITDAYIVVDAGADGIRTNNSEEEGRGYILIDGGHIEVTSVLDGIQAVTDLTVNAGEIVITCGGGSVNSSSDTGSDSMWGNWGGMGGGPGGGRPSDNTTTTDEESAKAIKGSVSVTITGGTFIIDSSDDAIHSNGNVTINGGQFEIVSGDDGVHADSTLTISACDMNLTKSYEGLEALDIVISGGDINIVASDDGLNAAGGADSSSMNGRPGQNTFSGTGSGSITISGGTITVNASGDGIDSNGTIAQTGGSCLVFGPTNDGNGALDYQGTFDMDGGTMIAFGSTGMA
ncbi:MAG: carbohydrate-binding domain-containing protein, partial [Clostridia bacterium]